MGVLSNMRIMVRVCQMYYLENQSQKEISAQLGISRPQISRFLATARRENIVTISVNDPYAKETQLQNQIRERYPVQEVFVFDTNAYEGEARLAEFGRMAVQCLDLFIADAAQVGIMSGQTIYSTINGAPSFSRRGLQVVPLVGGLGALNVDWHANSIAVMLAQKSGGMSYALNAPILVKDEQVRDALIHEPGILSVLQKGAACDVYIVGVGDITENSTTIKAGGLGEHDVASLNAAGAVASACCSFLDINGNILNTPVGKRLIGQSLTSLRKSNVVALAIGDRKAAAIHSVLSGGFVRALMTDIRTAEKLLTSEL